MPGPTKFQPTERDRALAATIRARRERWRMSQEDLAQSLGVSTRSVYRMEKAQRPVSMRELETLESVFGRLGAGAMRHPDIPEIGSEILDILADDKRGARLRKILPPGWPPHGVHGARDAGIVSADERVLLDWFRRLEPDDRMDFLARVTEQLGFTWSVGFMEQVAAGDHEGLLDSHEHEEASKVRSLARDFLNELAVEMKKRGVTADPAKATGIWWRRKRRDGSDEEWVAERIRAAARLASHIPEKEAGPKKPKAAPR